MRFQYKFATGYESIEVDEEWMAVLKEFDRLENNSDRRHRYHDIHYHAIPFEPDFMGKEDSGFSELDNKMSALFDGTPAFNYALSFLTPKHQEVLYRRAIQGETFSSIANSYGCSHASVAHSYYKRLCDRFRKRYEEWCWLHSNENIDQNGAGKIEIITNNLTPAQIMAIRAYRCQYKKIKEIAKLVNLPYSKVQECLHDNPILETPCPVCSKPVLQDAYSKMNIFCSQKCYLAWHRNNEFLTDSHVNAANEKERITEKQKRMIDFYRQLYIPIPTIGKIVGVPRLTVQSYVNTYPLPYTFCQFCGAKIPAQESRKLLKYCSDKCRERRDNKQRTLQKRNDGNVRERLLPTVEQLDYALDLRNLAFSFREIRTLAGLTVQDTNELFRFHKSTQKMCRNCRKMFTTMDIQEQYCSEKCQAKAKAKRKRKRKKEKNNDIQQTNNENCN